MRPSTVPSRTTADLELPRPDRSATVEDKKTYRSAAAEPEPGRAWAAAGARAAEEVPEGV